MNSKSNPERASSSRIPIHESDGFELGFGAPSADGGAKPQMFNPGVDTVELAVFLGEGTLVFPIGTGEMYTIGRGPENDISIDDPSVSRRHAVLHVHPDWSVEDLDSANGTHVRRGDRASALETEETLLGRGKTFGVAIGDTLVFGSVRACLRRAKGQEHAMLAEQTIVLDSAMRRVYDEARRVGRSDGPVLLLGETGVGKEVLARYVHAVSPRKDGPFVVVHVASLGASLLEAELFGHEKGSFTGAVEGRPGLFESARGGTVMLDEVGEIPLDVQVKLLRVLEERTVLRVGSRTPKPIDVRFVAATHRDLRAQVRAGMFREDLFYRLEGFSLTIPPLRARVAEIRPLASFLLASACRKLDRAEVPFLAESTWQALERHHWPGNVRELRNVMDRVAALCEGTEVRPDDLPRVMRVEAQSSSGPHSREAGQGLSTDAFRSAVEELDRKRISDALAAHGGNQSRAAEALGISRRTLINRLEMYGMARPRKNS